MAPGYRTRAAPIWVRLGLSGVRFVGTKVKYCTAALWQPPSRLPNGVAYGSPRVRHTLCPDRRERQGPRGTRPKRKVIALPGVCES
jgi:hypothetical protein